MIMISIIMDYYYCDNINDNNNNNDYHYLFLLS